MAKPTHLRPVPAEDAPALTHEQAVVEFRQRLRVARGAFVSMLAIVPAPYTARRMFGTEPITRAQARSMVTDADEIVKAAQDFRAAMVAVAAVYDQSEGLRR